MKQASRLSDWPAAAGRWLGRQFAGKVGAGARGGVRDAAGGSRALPFWGEGDPPPERASDPAAEQRGAAAILRIFARTWPYLRPQVVGRWREFPRRADRPVAPGDADIASPAVSTEGDAAGAAREADAAARPADGQWSCRYAPVLATLLVVLGPLLLLPAPGTDWQGDLLLLGTAAMAALAWVLPSAAGRLRVAATVSLVLVGAATFVYSLFGLRGFADSVHVGLVAVACSGVWVLHYRFEQGRLRLRVRLGSHLAYYFILVWAATLVTMVIALFSVDLISQSILQAEPLTPFLADVIGRPELGASQPANGSGAAAPAPDAAAQDGAAPPPDGTSPDAAADAARPSIDLAPLTAEQRHSLKWIYAAFMVFGWFAQLPAMMLLPYYYIFIMQRVNQDLRMALVERWFGLSLRYHSDHRVGDSVYRIYQDTAQVTAVIGTMTHSMQMLSTYAIGVVFLAALDPLLGGMALSIVLLALLWGRWFSPRMRERSLAAREANSDFTSRVQETFAAIRVIKAFGAEEREQERLERDSVRAFNASFRARSLMAVVGIVTFTFAAAALLAGQFLMAVWASGERETFATVLVGLVGLSFLTWNLSAYNWAQEQLGASSVSVRNLVTLWTQAQDMAMGLHRSFDILDLEPEVTNAPDAVPLRGLGRRIRFDGVDFAYEPDRPVLQGVSFAVEPGTVTALVGPTGSGKSTLVSLLLRLFDPDRGSVSIDGVDLRQLEVESLRANVSVALQENVLFGMSVRDNIRYVVPDASDEQVLEAARVACVDEYVAALPEGLDTVLADRGGKLSTGQRQRLSIARAILKDAPILILDEPTAALDAYTEHRVLERLSAWGRDRAIFLITHRISTIRQADRILYLDEGRILENGSHDELMALDGGRYRNFVETEARLARGAEDADPSPE